MDGGFQVALTIEMIDQLAITNCLECVRVVWHSRGKNLPDLLPQTRRKHGVYASVDFSIELVSRAFRSHQNRIESAFSPVVLPVL